MRMRITVEDAATGASHAVEVAAEPGTSVGSLLAALPMPVTGRPCFDGTQPLDPGRTLGETSLVPGRVLRVGAPVPEAERGLEAAIGALLVITGPRAGLLTWVLEGTHVLGRGQGATLPIPDHSASRAHARLVARPGVTYLEDLGSANGTLVDGVAVHGQTLLAPGSRIRLGDSELEWLAPPADPARVTRSPDARLDFDRAFAAAPAIPHARLTFPTADTSTTSLMGALLAAGLFAAMSVLMAVLFRQPAMMLFGLLSPLAAAAPYLVDRRGRRARRRGYAQARVALEQALAEHVELEERARQARTPGRAQLSLVAAGNGRGLWPRTSDCAHALLLRVGMADRPADVELNGTPWEGFVTPVLPGAPVTVDLRAAGVLGIVGDAARTAPLVRWLVLQLATLLSPEDLALTVISSRVQDGDDLGWASWLPHLEVGDAGRAACRVGVTDATRAARVAELRDLVATRTARLRTGAGAGAASWTQDVVVLLDGAVALRRLPGMGEILRDGPSVGVHTICVDTQDMLECRALCRFDGDVLWVSTSREEQPVAVQPEGMDRDTVGRLARAIAPMRDRLTLGGGQTAVPFPVRYLDLLALASPTPADVRALWAASPGPTTRVVLGADGSGPVTVDLAAQGPHTMLGGATGAGKSILLQTLVTSLLLANRPDELNLVLVDFKGGSAFLPFERCPHVVSLIRSTGATPADVFDEAAAVRVLASVRAEVRRRESILARYGGEIDEYWRARRDDPAIAALPRLVLVFDEFARVLEVSPDFLRELVNVAAKGRSLGMHLVLATQSLQGKLSAELKNNIDLRITLRQNEPSDSVEVLGVPDAAGIPGHLRGRAVILCTKDEGRRPRLFQSGYLGDPPPAEGAAPAKVRPVDWASLGEPRPEVGGDPAPGVTDQALVIAAIEQAAAELGVAAPSRPLLPPLPATLAVGDLDRLATAPVPASAVAFGLLDDPVAQAQPAMVLDLDGADRLMVAGGPQSGRTSTARALAAGLTARWAPDRLHLYVVEHRPGGLAELEGLPQCGAVISGDEPDRIRRLVEWLEAEVLRRRLAAMAGPGAARPPWVVVLVDGWEQFENRSDPTFVESSVATRLRGVVTAGTPVGIHVVAFGGQDMLSGKVPALFSRRLLLPFPQEDIRRGHLLPGTARPAVLPGRAVDAASGLHVQLALPDPRRADAGAGGTGGAGGSGGSGNSRVTADRTAAGPRAFPRLPVRVGGSEVPSAAAGTSPTWLPLGVGGPDVTPLGVDLFDEGPHLLLVCGPGGSGRTTAAALLARGLRAVGVGVLAIAPPRSPLRGLLPDDPGIRLLTGTTLTDGELRQAAEVFGAGRFAVVVDDFEQLTVVAGQDGFLERPTLLQEIAEPGSQGRHALVLAGDAAPVLSGQRRNLLRVVNEALGTGTRVVLTPATTLAARELGLALEPDQLFPGPAGRGYLAVGRDAQLVQLLHDARPGAATPSPDVLLLHDVLRERAKPFSAQAS